MKKILIPTDFSDQAENALKVAVQLAKKHNSEIYLLHTLELPLAQVDPLNTVQSLPEALYFMRLAHKQFEELLKKDYLKGLNVHEIVEFHEIFKGVFQVCKKYDIDLIVMGSHGTNGFKEMIIGSNTEKVVRTSEVPVLVVKKEHPFAKCSDFDNYTVNIYNDMNVEKGIMNFSKSISADLIGMCTHGRQGISHFFNGSISEDLVNHAKRPVMTFKIE
mgnify:CR=1 FL=1